MCKGKNVQKIYDRFHIKIDRRILKYNNFAYDS